MYKEVSKQLMSFIQQSPTAFHAVDTMKKILNQNGYQELSESQKWTIQLGGKTPCVYCNYRSVCQFDRGLEENQYQYLQKMSDKDVLTRIFKEGEQMKNGTNHSNQTR